MTIRTERILWALTLIAVLFTIVGARYGAVQARTHPFARTPAPHAIMMFDETQMATAATTTAAHDPFRLDHQPANVAFGDPVVPPTPKPPSPSQALALKGIVGGPPWQAILSGAPGRTGNVVVHMGDTVAGLRVRRVQHDNIVLAGPDSLLTLTLQRAWQ